MKIEYIGADPEVFVEQGGRIVPVQCTDLPGDKDNPVSVSSTISLLRDNVTAEFNITPAASRAQFVSLCRQGLEAVSKFGKPVVKASHVFDIGELTRHREAMEFGCSADFDAYRNGDPNPRPRAENAGLRSCGGHIHVSWDNPNDIERIMMVRKMDIFLGIPALFIDHDNDRRELYGKAGCMRPKPYGVEYRVLSNFWLAKPEYMRWVWDATMEAADASLSALYRKTSAEEVRHTINTGDIETAKIICSILDLRIPA